MLDTNLFNSVVRFVREYNYSDNLFSRSFLEYISQHYKDCFSKEKFVVSETPKVAQNSSIKVNSEITSKNNSFTVLKPKEYSNKDLINCYNQIYNLFFLLNLRLFDSFLCDLNDEFISRFGKTPLFNLLEDDRIGWGGKLLYLSETNDFIFADQKNETEEVYNESTKSFSYIYVSGFSKKQIVTEFRKTLKQCSNKEIVDKYNNLKRLYNIREQTFYIIVLNEQFISRFGKTPFQIVGNYLIDLGRKILYIKNINNFVFLDEN